MKSITRFRIVTDGNVVKRFYCKRPLPDKITTQPSKSVVNDSLTTMAATSTGRSSPPFAKLELESKFPALTLVLQVLGSGATGAPTSLYVMADKRRYLFNCGEGSLRLAIEHRTKVSKLDNIFITSKRCETVGGLAGFVLGMQGSGVQILNIHGPPGINEYFSAVRQFAIISNLNMRCSPVLFNKCYEDNAMKVQFIRMFPQTMSITGNNKLQKRKHKDGMHEEIHGVALCYICEPKKFDEMFVVNRCKELGIAADSFLEELRAGKSVNLPNGQILNFANFVASSAQCFLIIDCPTEGYIDSLVTNPVWSKYQKQKLDVAENLSPKIIVHFTPEKILLDPRYISWMESFDSTTQHLLINDSCRSLGSESVHRVQHKLNIVDDKIFPLLYSDCERIVESTTNPTSQMGDSESKSESDCELVESPACVIPPQLQHIKVPIILAETMLRYYIRPQKKNMLDDTWVIRLNPKKYNKEALEANMFSECCDNYKNAQNQLKKNASHEEFPQVLFLGTGSSMPNKIRNVSGILLQMTENTRMILDCGEGTYSQLLRFYGPHETAKVLVETKAIYISHLHSDHHLGLIGLLRARRSAFQQFNIPFQPLVLLAPEQILYLLTVYNVNFESIEDTYKLIYNQRLCLDHSKRNKNEIFGALGFKNIATIPVLHPANSFGVTLEHQSGWKITYSGDTRPCERLVELGRNSDLCIHEATMEDELIADAKSKRHSTTSEAIEIGEKMNAKFILLTHFSQRYSKVPKIDGGLPPNVGIAFDNMLVRLTDIPKLPSMYPIFKYLFAEDVEEMELRSELKRLKAMRGKKEARSC